MAVGHATSGRLIAIDGTRGLDLTAAAKRLARALRDAERDGGISGWDSSGIFTELAAAGADVPGPSARTLTLLYAADLAFRLRWQIRPALEAGQAVVAAPYVQSAMALGIAAGLPKRWLIELFRFAPTADISYRIRERGGRGKVAATGGYVELFCGAIASGSGARAPAELRARSIEHLDELERRHRCTTLTARGVAALGIDVTAPASKAAPRRGRPATGAASPRSR